MSVVAWWAGLRAVAVINITAWTFVAMSGDHLVNAQLVLSGVYVFGCAFRSFIPVYDIPRIGMVDSWASKATRDVAAGFGSGYRARAASRSAREPGGAE